MDLSKFATGSGAFDEMTEREKDVAEIVGDVLKIDFKTLGPNSDFFGVGGDSISAIRLCSRLKEEVGLHLTTKDLFTLRTIKRIGQSVGVVSEGVVLKELILR